MPRAPKPKDMRQNTERRDVGDVPDDTPEVIRVPPASRGWLRKTKAAWERYWTSPARFVTVESLDMDAIERLHDIYDELERARRELRKARVVVGSTGQDRASPFYTIIDRLNAEARQLEDRLGKSARSRLVLGMRVGGDDRPDESEPSETADTRVDYDDGTSEDPRLYVMDGGAR